MGPNCSGYLFRHWLPARALPLLARATFAIEVTGVMGKEVAAAAGGVNCFASPSAYSNQSRHRAVALGGYTRNILLPIVEGGEKLQAEASARGERYT